MSKSKKYMDKNVYESCIDRVNYTFDNFEKVYVSLSGGKDSTVMIHIVCSEARKRKRKVGVFIVDLEGQYKFTVDNIYRLLEEYKDVVEPYWFCLPISLRNAVSVYEPKWVCWDKEQEKNWIRELPEPYAITDENLVTGFYKGMEFEDFIIKFADWYADGVKTACMVGIRADESLNRFRTIASTKKIRYEDKQFTTKVTENVYNVYPIYDWNTKDVWIYHAKYNDKKYNELYDYMYKAGLTVHQMRTCQPYGDDQRRGLWLFHLIEPITWAKVVSRVNGANSGALYVMESGNINGYNKISCPKGHNWKSFALMLLNSMPEKTKVHFENKILLFEKWWVERGYPDGIPDEANANLESKKGVPSWRRVCKTLLRNDYWCKGLGFSQHKNEAYSNYLKLMKKRREQWKEETECNLSFT